MMNIQHGFYSLRDYGLLVDGENKIASVKPRRANICKGSVSVAGTNNLGLGRE